MNKKLSEHFWTKEFVCSCGKCDYSDPDVIPKIINPDIIPTLEKIRMYTNVPIFISGGVRCLDRQIKIYQERYGEFWRSHMVWRSNHFVNESTGWFNACDCVSSYNLYKFAAISAHFGFAEVGWYQKITGGISEDYFVHNAITPNMNFYRKVYIFK